MAPIPPVRLTIADGGVGVRVAVAVAVGVWVAVAVLVGVIVGVPVAVGGSRGQAGRAGL